MPVTLDELFEDACHLPTKQRLNLADLLYESVEAEDAQQTNLDLHPAWYPELERRSEALRSGKVKAIPAEEVFRELDELIDNL